MTMVLYGASNQPSRTGGRKPICRLLVLPLFFSSLILVAGCIGSDGEAGFPSDVDGVEEEVNNQQAGSNRAGSWYMEEEVQIWYLAAEGTPFHSFFEADSETQCDPEEPGQPSGYINLRLPDGGKFLDIHLETDILDTSGPGAGYATFMFRQDNSGPWTNPDGEKMEQDPPVYLRPPQDETRFNVSEPASGQWTVWVWPHGPVMNQTFTLTLTAQGASAVMGDLAETGRFGIKC